MSYSQWHKQINITIDNLQLLLPDTHPKYQKTKRKRERDIHKKKPINEMSDLLGLQKGSLRSIFTICGTSHRILNSRE